MKGLLFPVQVPYKPYDPVRFVVFDLFCRLKPAVLEIDRQLGIQVGCLVKSALYLLRAETCLFKDLVVGQEIDRSSSLFRSAGLRQEEVRKKRFPLSISRA